MSTMKRTIWILAALAMAPGCAAPEADETAGDGQTEDPLGAAKEEIAESQQALTSCCGGTWHCDPPPPCYPELECTGFPPRCTTRWVCPEPNCYWLDSPCSCMHSTCTTGERLDPTCSPAAAAICAADPYCCTVAWDSVCVSEVESIARLSCDACN